MYEEYAISPDYAARVWCTMKLNYNGHMMGYSGIKKGYNFTEAQFAVFRTIVGKYNTIGKIACLYASNLIVNQNMVPSDLLSSENEVRYIEFRRYILNPVHETVNQLQNILTKYSIKQVLEKLPALLVSGEITPELAVTLNRCYSIFEYHSEKKDYVWGILKPRMEAHMKFCSLKDENLIPVITNKIEILIGEMKNAITS